MIKKKDKHVLIISVILTFIFLTITIYGAGLKILNKNMSKEIINEGELNYYKDDELIGSYTCISNECSAAKSLSEENNINYFKEGQIFDLGIINDSYVFVSDDNRVVLYDIVNNVKVTEFQEIKYYNTRNNNNLLFIKNQSGKWGAISLSDLKIKIPYDYDYLGLANNINDGMLNSDKIIAKKQNQFYIINNLNSIIIGPFSNLIYDYTADYNFVENLNNKLIYDNMGNQILNNIFIKNIIKTENYYLVIDINNNAYVYNDLKSNIIFSMVIPSYNEISMRENDVLEIYLDEKLHQSLDI